MPFLLSVPFGREKKAVAALAKGGISSKPTTVKGYLVSDMRPPRPALEKARVSEVTEISESAAERLLSEAPTRQVELNTGAAVRVASGIYQGFSGIVREVSEEFVEVDIAAFGKVLPVKFKASELEPLTVCDWA